jgi:regulatory protein
LYTVTRLEALKNRRYLVSIKLDNKTKKLDVSEDIMVEFRLVNDKVISKTDFKKLVIANDRDIVYQKVLHYALFKMRCVKDVKDYLTKNKIPYEEQSYYLSKLTKTKILDDLKYAEIYVRESFDFKKIGPNKIVFELNKKKIDREIYDQFIEKIKPVDIEENLNHLFNKKLNSIKNKSINIATQNIKQFLVTKGYSFESVASFVDKSKTLIRAKINEDEILEKDYLIAERKYKKSTNKRMNIISYLLRKGYDYGKVKMMMGEKKYEEND